MRLRMQSLQPTRVSVGHSLKRQARTSNAQRWGITLDYAPMTRAQFAPIWAFVIAQRGQYDTFQLVLPAPLYAPQGIGAVGSPSPSVDNELAGSPTEAQLGRAPWTRGWTPNATVLKAGDFLAFGDHSKVYMAREDIVADGSGYAQLAIEPSLVAALTQGAGVTTDSVPFTMALAQDQHEFELRVNPEFGFSVQMVEVY